LRKIGSFSKKIHKSKNTFNPKIQKLNPKILSYSSFMPLPPLTSSETIQGQLPLEAGAPPTIRK